MRYIRMPIEAESPEEFGYERIRNNLSESSIRDKTLQELGIVLNDLTLFYGDHRGLPLLRQEIALQGKGLQADHVLVTAGAAGALYIVATALLEKDEHLVVVHPNYATNLETPKAIGAHITHIHLTFDNGFQLDPEQVAAAIRPDTKLISVTVPHNPTGTMCTLRTMETLIAIAERAGCPILFDETYRDLTFGEPLPLAASLSPRAISVSSLSKAYGVPGIRIGWIITRDPALAHIFLAAKEQIGICGSVVDEAIAYELIQRRTAVITENRGWIDRRLSIVRDWIGSEPLIEWIEPAGGVVCFPRIAIPDTKLDVFYDTLLQTHKTYLAPGHWFQMPRQYFRLGFGWPTETELQDGLAAISATAREVLKQP